MAQINAAGRQKMRHADMRDGVEADNLLFSRHGIDYHAVDPGGKGLVYTGAPIEEHIQHLRRGLVRVLGLDNAVAALGEIGPCILFG